MIRPLRHRTADRSTHGGDVNHTMKVQYPSEYPSEDYMYFSQLKHPSVVSKPAVFLQLLSTTPRSTNILVETDSASSCSCCARGQEINPKIFSSCQSWRSKAQTMKYISRVLRARLAFLASKLTRKSIPSSGDPRGGNQRHAAEDAGEVQVRSTDEHASGSTLETDAHCAVRGSRVACSSRE